MKTNDPNGYSGEYGFAPNAYGKVARLDGTVPPCGAIGSIRFTPEDSIRGMKHYKENDGTPFTSEVVGRDDCEYWDEK